MLRLALAIANIRRPDAQWTVFLTPSHPHVTYLTDSMFSPTYP
jgi:hypothetical protein